MAGRIELKYLIGYEARAEVLERWRPYLEAAPYTDERAIYPIMSLYFDSPSLRFYDEKLEGETMRNKVRLRGYGYDWAKVKPCFLEIKRKYDSRVLKFRKNLGRFRPEYWQPEKWRLGEDRDDAHLAALSYLYRLRPAVQILYQREAYESSFFPGLRVAFDTQLVALHPGERVTQELLRDRRRHCMRETDYVFEVKSNGNLPKWVLDGLHAIEVQQRAISKYTAGIEKLGLQNREIGVYA